MSAAGAALLALGVAAAGQPGARKPERVKPGISVLLDEQLSLVRGKRVALLADGAAVDERGTADEELLRSDKRARTARVEVVGALRADLNTVNASSLDSLVRNAAVLLVDLQDVGARPGPALPLLIDALRCGERHSITVVVLDRPNPVNGSRVDGPVADGSYGIPLRHAMTAGELATYVKDSARVNATLTVVPMRNWRRSSWFDDTGLRWRAPSREFPTLASAIMFGGLAPLQAANVSLGRGTVDAWLHVAAPWVKSAEVARLLNDRLMPGVQFHDGRFAMAATEGHGANRSAPGVRVELLDRERATPARIGAAILWALVKTSPDSLRVDAARFDALMGAPHVREALLRGEDPDDVLDRELVAAVRFRELVRRSLLYR